MWARGYWAGLATAPNRLTMKPDQMSTVVIEQFRGHMYDKQVWGGNIKKRLIPLRHKYDSNKIARGLKSLFSIDERLRQLVSQRVRLSGRFIFYRRPFPPWVAYMLRKRPFGAQLATEVEAVADSEIGDDPDLGIVDCPMRSKNYVEFYDEGESCMESMLKSIHQARKRIWMESYCIDESAIGRIFITELTKAANRGVDVVVSVDGAGSLGVPEQLRVDFRKKGGKLVIFNPLWRPIGPLVYRNHRKVLICDDHAYCGSMNIDWRASGNLKNPNLMTRHAQLLGGLTLKRPFWNLNNLINMIFRDRSLTRPGDYNHHFLVQGPIVNDLAESFCQILKKSRLPLTRENWLISEQPNAIKQHQGISNVRIKLVQADGYKNGISNYSEAITGILCQAKSSLIIATSYFHPPGKLRQCLARTLRSGIASMLILSGMSDVPFDSQATLAILPYFLVGKNNFCRCFFTKQQHCHAKTITVDGRVALSGSFNLDRYSAHRNCEVGLVFASKRVTQLINSRLHGLISASSKGSIEYTLEDARNMSILKRILCLISYHAVRATGWSFLDGFQQNREAINVNIPHESLD